MVNVLNRIEQVFIEAIRIIFTLSEYMISDDFLIPIFIILLIFGFGYICGFIHAIFIGGD